METETVQRDVIYNENTDTWLLYFDSQSSKQLSKFLDAQGFIDADILKSGWFVYHYRVYGIPDDWHKSVADYGYFVMSFVGHLWHVIPKDEQTTEQYYFIKNIFEPY